RLPQHNPNLTKNHCAACAVQYLMPVVEPHPVEATTVAADNLTVHVERIACHLMLTGQWRQAALRAPLAGWERLARRDGKGRQAGRLMAPCEASVMPGSVSIGATVIVARHPIQEFVRLSAKRPALSRFLVKREHAVNPRHPEACVNRGLLRRISFTHNH